MSLASPPSAREVTMCWVSLRSWKARTNFLSLALVPGVATVWPNAKYLPFGMVYDVYTTHKNGDNLGMVYEIG